MPDMKEQIWDFGHRSYRESCLPLSTKTQTNYLPISWHTNVSSEDVKTLLTALHLRYRGVSKETVSLIKLVINLRLRQPVTGGASRNPSTKTDGTAKTVHCWKCGLTGHTRRDCPSPRKDRPKCATCNWCGERHHNSCTENKSTEDESTYTTVGPVHMTEANPTDTPDETDQILHEKLVTINHRI